MKPASLIAALMLTGILKAQVSEYPNLQSFEEPFTTGHNVYFLPNWWGNYVAADTMGQYAGVAKIGDYSLFMKPDGEEFPVTAQVSLDLTGKTNSYTEFWIAIVKQGLEQDRKKIKFTVAFSYDGGETFPFSLRAGPHEGFLNEDKPFEKFIFPFPPATDNQSNVVLRFSGSSSGGPDLSGILLLDSVAISQSEQDTFPPSTSGEGFKMVDENTIVIPFIEPVNSDSALKISNYSFVWATDEEGVPIVGEGPLPEVENVSLSENGLNVTLTLGIPLTVGETYHLQIFNATDLPGNVADTIKVQGIVHNILPPGSLSFSEIFFTDPLTDSKLERLQFIEIYNPTNEVVPLGGLRIKGAISSRNLPNVKLQPGEYWVATLNAEAYYATFGKEAWEWKGPWIEYEQVDEHELVPQSLVIANTNRHSGIFVDSIGIDFKDPAWAGLVQLGRSIEVCNKFTYRLSAENWALADTAKTRYNYWGSPVGFEIYATPGEGCYNSKGPTVNLGNFQYICGLKEHTLDAGNPGAVYRWSTGETTQTIKVKADGTYSVTVNNGVGAASGEITVAFVPDIVAAGTIPAEVCQFTEVAFADTSEQAAGWSWNFGDGNTSTERNPLHIYADVGSYTVRLTATSNLGCGNTISREVKVKPNEINWTLPAQPCEGSEATFTGSSVAAARWAWTFGDGHISSLQNPSHIYGSDGTYTVSLTATNMHGCTSSTSGQVVVADYEVGWILPDLFCTGSEATFTDNSAPTISWAWDFGDGSTSGLQNPVHVYSEAGKYAVSLIVGNAAGCSRRLSKEIEVNSFELEWTLSPSAACTYTPVEFADNSAAATGWLWDFGDGNGSTEQHPSHVYYKPGKYVVSLSATNAVGCTAGTADTLTVSICSGVEESAAEEQLVLYPNPTDGPVFLRINWNDTEQAQLSVLNAAGQTVMMKTLSKKDGSVHSFNADGLSNGLYLIRLQVGHSNLTRKLFIEK